MTDKFPADHLSASFINKYLTCPLAALYYRQNKPKDWDARYAECGSLVHSVIERFYNPAAELYEPPPGMMDREMEKRYDASIKGFENLVATVPRFRPDGSQQAELKVETELCGVPYIGFIDLLIRKDGRIWIEDWKTGSYTAENEEQMRLYTLIASRLYDTPVSKITATLNYLREKPGKQQRTVPFTSEKAIETKLKKYVVEPIWDLNFTPKIGSHCSRCEYRRICEAFKN